MLNYTRLIGVCCVLTGFGVALAQQQEVRVERRAVSDEVSGPREEVRVVVTNNEDVELPPQWIGVRVAPVPQALAAHIGPEGLLVANVVVGSPADAAGIAQYDVIRAYHGLPVDSIDGLFEAITAGGMEPVTLELVRGATPLELTLLPVERPATDGPMEMKYPEEFDPLISDAMQVRSFKLDQGPGGQYFLQDLGALDELPKALQGLSRRWEGKGHGPFFVPADPLAAPGGWQPGLQLDLDMNAEAAITIELNEDGNVLRIERLPDGQIDVTRTAPEGAPETVQYPDVEALQQGDPEAYEQYQRFSGYRQPKWIFMRPDGEHLQEMRGQLDDRMRVLIKRLGDASAEVELRVEDARQTVEQLRKQLESAGAPGEVHARSLMTWIDDDGRVSVTVREDGHVEKYEFESEAAFEREAPELYAEFKALAQE